MRVLPKPARKTTKGLKVFFKPCVKRRRRSGPGFEEAVLGGTFTHRTRLQAAARVKAGLSQDTSPSMLSYYVSVCGDGVKSAPGSLCDTFV
uniref:Uncharacterized protein n=1 Tax=Knipowitschia caucasica TaxID=637954 RepID=A0AAV2L9H8_KNICA